LGSGAVIAELSPKEGYGSDNLEPLIDIFKTLKDNPDLLKEYKNKLMSG
jgi:DNA adenine methylase